MQLFRTSSAASISSDDAARRTRKRFTSLQLMMLEQLFHQTSHPTREEREAVAKSAGMEMKSVTIWFQNKRQTERKVALYHATSQPSDGHRNAPFPSSSPSTLSLSLSPPSTSASTAHPIQPHVRTLSMSLSTSSHTHTPRRKVTPPRARPSLDRIATRSESRLPPPRTPTKPHDPHASLWDNMPSSPLAPPASPPSRDLIEFMSSSRTLEWACAAARLNQAGKEGPCARERHSSHDREPEQDRNGDGDGVRSGDRDVGEETEEDDIEAVTPEGSLGASDAVRWHGAQPVRARPRLPPPVFGPPSDPLSGSVPARTGTWPLEVDVWGKEHHKEAQDEDTMRAALALCGLGRRSG